MSQCRRTPELGSPGGADDGRSTAEELGLAHCFVGYLPKPDVFIDDVRVEAWRNTVQLHPNEVVNQTVLELPIPRPATGSASTRANARSSSSSDHVRPGASATVGSSGSSASHVTCAETFICGSWVSPSGTPPSVIRMLPCPRWSLSRPANATPPITDVVISTIRAGSTAEFSCSQCRSIQSWSGPRRNVTQRAQRHGDLRPSIAQRTRDPGRPMVGHSGRPAPRRTAALAGTAKVAWPLASATEGPSSRGRWSPTQAPPSTAGQVWPGVGLHARSTASPELLGTCRERAFLDEHLPVGAAAGNRY